MLTRIARDKLEQYSRREKVKVYGLKEKDKETEEDLVEGLKEVGKEGQVTNCQRRAKVNGEFKRLQLQQPISDYNKFMKGSRPE